MPVWTTLLLICWISRLPHFRIRKVVSCSTQLATWALVKISPSGHGGPTSDILGCFDAWSWEDVGKTKPQTLIANA